MSAILSTNTREDFWRDFPGEHFAFLEAVRGGIHYEISVDHFIDRRVRDLRSEYDGQSTEFLKFIYGEWRFNPKYVNEKYGRHVSSALAEYYRVVIEQQTAKDLAVTEYQKTLALGPPTPPSGFYWREDSSCVRLPQVHRYNLWSNSLGYPEGEG